MPSAKLFKEGIEHVIDVQTLFSKGKGARDVRWALNTYLKQNAVSAIIKL